MTIAGRPLVRGRTPGFVAHRLLARFTNDRQRGVAGWRSAERTPLVKDLSAIPVCGQVVRPLAAQVQASRTAHALQDHRLTQP